MPEVVEPKVTIATVGHLLRGNNGNTEILLGERQSRLHNRVWNGPGGKAWPKESIPDCLYREVKEETGIEIIPSVVSHLASIDFYKKINGAHILDWQVHFFSITNWEGEPKPLEGFTRFEWFGLHNLPYELMMPDAKVWLPEALSAPKDKALQASIYYAESENLAVEDHRFSLIGQMDCTFTCKEIRGG